MPYLRGYTYALVVDDLNNCCELSIVRSTIEKDHASNLNRSPVACCDRSVAHFEDSIDVELANVGLVVK
jgi:hypothetical protein